MGVLGRFYFLGMGIEGVGVFLRCGGGCRIGVFFGEGDRFDWGFIVDFR